MAERRKATTRAAAKSPTKGRVIPDLSIWLQFTRIGGGLTPVAVSNIVREADGGIMYRLCDLGNEARQKDAHLQSVLSTSEESIAGLDWELELPEDASRKEKKAAKQIEESLRAVGMSRLFAHQAGARFYGYAVTEPIYKRDAGFIVPSGFNYIAPRRFGFRQDDGAFVWRDQNMSQGGVDIRDAYPNRFIVSQPRVTGDVPCREGLIRVLMWAALFRSWTIGDWMKLGEIAWKPWRIGKYQKGASQEDINGLTEILEGLTTSGVATLPEATAVEIMWAKGADGSQAGTHAALASMMAAEMSKAVLGQTLTTEQGKVGSQALGNVQDEQKDDILEGMARYVAADISRDLLAPLYAWNYDDNVRPARLRFLTDDAKDLVSFGTGIASLAAAGVKMPSEWVRDQIGIPTPADGEETIGGAVVEPVGANS